MAPQERKPRCGGLSATRPPAKKALLAGPLQHDRREDSNDEEDAAVARQRRCGHKNVRGSRFQSPYCPLCGREINRPVEEDDDDASSQALRRALAARKNGSVK
jgi:hypothetical protein